MGPDEHVQLARALHRIKGKAIVSGYASALYDRELYYDWHREEKRTHIMSQGGSKRATEVLWMNFEPCQKVA
jgi:hypothetical protein